jgi:hypothetical protein
MTDDYGDEWDQLTEKELLVGILTELQQIRMAVTQAESDASDDADSADTYECTHCGAAVTAAERTQHAHNTHNAPPEMVDGMFEVVE